MPNQPEAITPEAVTPGTPVNTGADPIRPMPLAIVFAVFLRIGLLSFGGPAAQIALMHRVLVEERKWLDDQTFLHALSFCMLLPGPEAMQLATWCGWRLRGVTGGLIAGSLFVMPGAIIIALLASVYALFGQVPVVASIFIGIKAAVLAIVVQALLRIGRRALHLPLHKAVAAASFVAIFLLMVPFPLIILLAALIGFSSAPIPPVHDAKHLSDSPVSWRNTVLTAAGWSALWLLPLLAMAAVIGPDHLLSKLALFCSQLAVVTFGGAYAVLSYIAQDVVIQHRWLDAQTMMDGLGLAETTPGPLILVTQFVAFLAAYTHGSPAGLPMAFAGLLVSLWATFIPCFLWIFTGAPFIERLRDSPRLAGALAAVTAAVVGVILNLAIWFALHVFFSDVTRASYGPVQLWTPGLASLQPVVVGLALLAGYLVFIRKASLATVLGLSATAALLINGWS